MITVKTNLQSQVSPLFPKKHPGTLLLLGGPLPGSPMFARTFICLNGVPCLAETAFKALRTANIPRPTLHLGAAGLPGLRQKNYMSCSLCKKEILSRWWMMLVFMRNITTCRRGCVPRSELTVWMSPQNSSVRELSPRGLGQICFSVQQAKAQLINRSAWLIKAATPSFNQKGGILLQSQI